MALFRFLGPFKLTFSKLFSKKVTLCYPDERKIMCERWRGRPMLRLDQDGRDLCVACGLCARICPAEAITVIGEKLTSNVRSVVKFEIDIGRCCFCGFCAESCPKNAICMSSYYEYSVYSKNELILDKDKLIGQK